MSGAVAPPVDDAGLVEALERALEGALGRPARVASLDRRPSPFATLFPAEVVTVRIAGGGELSLFVKHLDARQADHPEKRRRDREVCVYTRLLREPTLPVPRCHGGWWDPDAQRGLLLLEHIDDWNLKYQDLEHWYTAARRLAHLHAHFARRAPELLAGGFLLRFDEAFFAEWAQRALDVVAPLSAPLGRRLAAVVDRYGAPAALLAAQPPTLVHNDLAPKNVIADRGTDPARICVVDWEMAGVGCGLLDLVHLTYGFDAEHERRMRAAYCEELAGSPVLPAAPSEVAAVFAACALHKTLYRLAFSATWRLPPERVDEWVGDAERLVREAGGAP